MKHWAKALLSGLGFLTPIPLPDSYLQDTLALEKSPVFFPFIGLLLGSFAALFAVLALLILPTSVVAAMLIILLILFSSGLHMDGLADTCDGFFSSRPRERIFEIMKDSCTGSMGVIGIASILLIKYAALSSLSHGALITAALLTPLCGRCALIIHWRLLPGAKPGEGLSSLFSRTWVTAAVVPAILLPLFIGGLTGGYLTILVLLSVMILILLFSFFCRSRIGGFTGDTLGAACELGEAAFLVAFVIIQC